MAAFNDDTRSVLDDPFKAPAIGLTDRLDDNDSEIKQFSENASSTGHNGDASELNGGGQHPDGSVEDDEDAWDDDEDGRADNSDDEHLSLYENWLDGSEKHWKVDQVVESQTLRKRLRLVGQDRFIRETLESGRFTAKQLCVALGARIPFFLEGAEDEKYYMLLSICISRELQKRVKLPQWNTLEDAAHLLKKAKKIVVLTGAGISTSLGIPDFRSKDTGLYSRLEHLGLSDPQEVFDIDLFREDPSIFYSIAKDILPPSKKYTPTHRFIKILEEKGKLLTNYTQNIDNLEQAAGISKKNLVQCHGSFATATCIKCKHQVPGSAIHKDLRAGKVAYCEECSDRMLSVQNAGVKRKRSSDGMNSKSKRKRNNSYDSDITDDEDEDDDIIAPGVMKPDITFFGEALPSTFHDRLIKHDLALVDLVLVIGTSLKVAPVSEVVGVIPPEVPQIFISREPCNHAEFDIDLLGDCDIVLEALCRAAGWSLDHVMTYENPINVTNTEGYQSRFEIDRIMYGVERTSYEHTFPPPVGLISPTPVLRDGMVIYLSSFATLSITKEQAMARAQAANALVHKESSSVETEVDEPSNAPKQGEDDDDDDDDDDYREIAEDVFNLEPHQSGTAATREVRNRDGSEQLTRNNGEGREEDSWEDVSSED